MFVAEICGEFSVAGPSYYHPTEYHYERVTNDERNYSNLYVGLAN